MARKKLTDKGKICRVDDSFLNFIREIPISRIRKGVDNQKVSDREVTRMIMNTENLPFLKKELTTKPRRIR